MTLTPDPSIRPVRIGRFAGQLPLGFGGSWFVPYAAPSEEDARLLGAMEAAWDAGIRHFDTAGSYGGGHSEELYARFLEGRRAEVFLASKSNPEETTAAAMTAAIDASLRRLGTDYIDLYQSHFDDPGTPLAETMGAYAELIAEGKVRAVGASNYSAARLREALTAAAELGVPRYESLQPHYNLVEREGFEEELQPLCYEEGIGVITYFSLAAGFLTGKYRSEEDLGQSPRGNGVKKYLNQRGLAVLRVLDEVSARHGVTQAQVAIAWLANRGGVTAPIASAMKLEQLEDLLKAATLKLSAEDMAALDKASAPA